MKWVVRLFRRISPLLIAGLCLDSRNGVAQLPPPVSNGAPSLRALQLGIMDVLAQSYGTTDWSLIGAWIAANSGESVNPNIVFIPVSLGNVYWSRYEASGREADLDRALGSWDWVAENHWLWGERWLSAPLMSYLDLSLWRARSRSGISKVVGGRIEAIWQKAMHLTRVEADLRLANDFPHRPYDSSLTGDSKAEENAWEAALLAAAANFMPSHPSVSAWNEKARQLAYDAITRPSDPPDAAGVKVTTVTEDFELANHGFFPNPTYAAATLLLLSQGALAYRLSGNPIPEEFGHNLLPLYRAYRAYSDTDLSWLVPADPAGSAALFPFAFDPELEDRVTRCKADDGYLWIQTEAVPVMEFGQPLWTAILNSKAVMFFLVGSFLWHEPPVAPMP